MRGNVVQLVERRLVIKKLLVQCLNRAFCHWVLRKGTSQKFPIGVVQSTRRSGPIRLKTCKQNRKTGCPVLMWQTYAGCQVHTNERRLQFVYNEDL